MAFVRLVNPCRFLPFCRRGGSFFLSTVYVCTYVSMYVCIYTGLSSAWSTPVDSSLSVVEVDLFFFSTVRVMYVYVCVLVFVCMYLFYVCMYVCMYVYKCARRI